MALLFCRAAACARAGTRISRTFAATIRKIAPAPQPIIFFRTEAHALVFHVGRPVDSILEWENVDTWASRAGTYFVVMPADVVSEWPSHVHSGKLMEIARNDPANACPPEPLSVLLKTCPNDRPTGRWAPETCRHARPAAASRDCRRFAFNDFGCLQRRALSRSPARSLARRSQGQASNYKSFWWRRYGWLRQAKVWRSIRS